MHNITDIDFLHQLNVTNPEKSLKQLEQIKKGFRDIDKEKSHIIALSQKLSHMDAFVSLSSTRDLIKAKTLAQSEEGQLEFSHIVSDWAKKHKVEIEYKNKVVIYLKRV